MRKIILAAAAVAALLALGAPENRVAAMPVAAPAALGIAATDLNPVQQVRWPRHWGWGWGWRRPWIAPWPVYWGWRRPYWGGPYWGGPHWGPRPWGPYYYGYYGRPWGPCCGWGWHRHWHRW